MRTDVKRFIMSYLALCVALQLGRPKFKDFSASDVASIELNTGRGL